MVVIGLGPDENPAIAGDVFTALPGGKVLALSHDQRRGWLFAGVGQCDVLADLSPASLAAALSPATI